jgi:hypothetical protein
MKEICLYVYPYGAYDVNKTSMSVNGRQLMDSSSKLTKYVVQQPMERWLYPFRKGLLYWEGILKELIKELGDDNISITFYGRKCDYQIFNTAIEEQKVEEERRGTEILLTTSLLECWNSDKARNILLHCIDIMKSNVISRREDLRKLNNIKELIEITKVHCNFQNNIEADAENVLQGGQCKQDIEGPCAIFLDENETSSKQLDYIDLVMKEVGTEKQNLIFFVSHKAEEENENYEIIKSKYNSMDSVRCFFVHEFSQSLEHIKLYAEVKLLPGYIAEASKQIKEVAASIPDYENNSFVLQLFDEIDSMIEVPR